MYEHRGDPVISRKTFLRRLSRHAVASLAIVAVSLVIGTLGYRYLAGIGWVDAFLNASMILTGMGPVNVMHTDAAKLFSAFYALYSGIVFLVATGILLAPLIHRLLHRLHAER